MSNHEQDKANLKECLLKAHQLVGEKVEIKEEGAITACICIATRH